MSNLKDIKKTEELKKLKEWTFLFYANGHNELEPETWQSVVDIQKEFAGTNINVVVQVSREEKDVVSLLRQTKFMADEKNVWSGVRRYVFLDSDKKSPKFYTLDNINMACPIALYDFIKWGITYFPAKRYMLSIPGHIYQFVGMCPDYSGDSPLMMGFPEISACIQRLCEEHKIILDILVLDTCYASTIEILYELARYEQPLIKNVLTYIGKGPLEGLSYRDVINILEYTASAPTEDILSSLVNKISLNHQLYGLIALQINHDVLELVKQLFCKLTSAYLVCKQTYLIELTPEELLSNYREDYPWSHYLKPIHMLLKNIIIAKQYAEYEAGGVLPIHILYQKIPDEQRKNLYCRLAFSKQNAWASMLCGFPPETQLALSTSTLEPIHITKNVLNLFVCAANENLSIELHKQITDALIKKKNWSFA